MKANSVAEGAYVAVNVGSSSVKTSYFWKNDRIDVNLNFFGLEEQKITIRHGTGKCSRSCVTSSMEQASAIVFSELKQQLEESEFPPVEKVVHRVIFAGFGRAVQEIDDLLIDELTDNSYFSSRHNIFCLAAIFASQSTFPEADQIAVRDMSCDPFSSFDQRTIPFSSSDIGKWALIPSGYHGLAVKAALAAANRVGFSDRNSIIVHVGSGVSVTAVSNGRVVYNSMEFAACDGPIMHNRSGNVPPGMILRLLKTGLSQEQLANTLNLNCGIYGLADFSPTGSKTVEQILAEGRGDPAVNTYLSRILALALHALEKLPRLDTVAFSGGICWKHQWVCDSILEGLQTDSNVDVSWTEAEGAMTKDQGDFSTLRIDIDEQTEILAAARFPEQHVGNVTEVYMTGASIFVKGVIFGITVDQNSTSNGISLEFPSVFIGTKRDFLDASGRVESPSAAILTDCEEGLADRFILAKENIPIIGWPDCQVELLRGKLIYADAASGKLLISAPSRTQ